MSERRRLRHTDDEPTQSEFEAMEQDEERDVVEREDAPDDVRSDVLQRIESYEDIDEASASADDARAL
ncbi:MAG TPA: hypothetical protein VFN49_02350 [Candidatus Aquilonibacter sp.]|nr:hypothetical protein [Candidatus Aquilonibacter sp.]